MKKGEGGVGITFSPHVHHYYEQLNNSSPTLALSFSLVTHVQFKEVLYQGKGKDKQLNHTQDNSLRAALGGIRTHTALCSLGERSTN